MIAATNVDTFGRAVLGYRRRMCDSYTLGSNALSGAATAQESQADVRIDEDLPQSPGRCKNINSGTRLTKLTLPTANGIVPNSANGVR